MASTSLNPAGPDEGIREDVARLIAGSDPAQHEEVDLPRYRHELAAFLPGELVDAHVHLWTPECLAEPLTEARFRSTMLEAIRGFSAAAFQSAYDALLPGKRASGVVFGLAAFEADADRVNAFVAHQREGVLARLLIPPRPASVERLRQLVREGGFVGFKPYPEHARHLPLDEVTLDDFVTDEQWQVADELGLVILLHPPRPRRMADPLNIAALERRLGQHPGARVVLAHLGATACPEGFAEALARLQGFSNLLFDTALVGGPDLIAMVLDAVGPGRVLFGTDLPFALVRGRRACVDGAPRLLTQETYPFGTQAGGRCTYLLFETLLAVRDAARRVGLSRSDVEAVFRDNAWRVFRAGSEPA